MSRITAFFKANPFRAMAYVMTGIAVLALLSRVTGFYSLFG